MGKINSRKPLNIGRLTRTGRGEKQVATSHKTTLVGVISIFAILFLANPIFAADVVSASYVNNTVLIGDNVTYQLTKPVFTLVPKITNAGSSTITLNEIKLISPNSETEVLDYLSSANLSIAPSQEILLDDSLKWKPSGAGYEGASSILTTSCYSSCETFTIELPKPEILYKTTLYTSTGYQVGYRHAYAIDVSSNNITWARVANYLPENWQGNLVTDEFDPIYAKFIKITGTARMSDGGTGTLTTAFVIQEFNAYSFEYGGKRLSQIEKPVLAVYYNDFTGAHSMISAVDILHENISLAQYALEMKQPLALSVSTPATVAYGNSTNVTITVLNPHNATIANGYLFVKYYSANGTEMKSFSPVVSFLPGTNAFDFIFNTTEFGPQYKGTVFSIKATAADYQQTSFINNSGTLAVDNTTSVNNPPVLAPISDITVNAGSKVTVQLNASDTDNDSLSFTFESSLVFVQTANYTFETTPATAGTYPATVTVSDGLGGNATQSFTVTANSPPCTDCDPKPPSGGGGGGGGSAAPLPNCILDVGYVPPGASKVSTCDKPNDVYVSQITVTPKNELANAKIQVVRYPSKPVSWQNVSGDSFAYLDIKPINFKSEDIDKTTIYFLVSKEWLKKNKLENSKGVLYHESENGWSQNNGTLTLSDSDLITYKVTVNGFSKFIIGAVPIQGETPVEVIAPPEPVVVEQPAEPEIIAQPTEPQNKGTGLLLLTKIKNPYSVGVFGALLLVGLLAYAYHTERIEIPRIELPRFSLQSIRIRKPKQKTKVAEKGKKPSGGTEYDYIPPNGNKKTDAPSYLYKQPLTLTTEEQKIIDTFDDRDREIIKIVYNEGGKTTTAKLHHETGIPRPSIKRRIASMEQRGIVKTEMLGRKVKRVLLTEKLRPALKQ